MQDTPQLVPKPLQRHRIRKWSKYLGIILFCAVVLYGICTTPAVQALLVKPLAISEKPKYSDVVIVLGGGLRKDGSVGPIVEQRIQKGVELATVPFAPVVLMSGGPVKSKNFIESVQMAAYAKTLGVVPPVVTEERSTSTRENALQSKIVVEEHNWTTALLVTSEFHSKRACAVFRKLSFAVTCVAAPEEVSNVRERLKLTKAIFREYGATIYYKLLGYI